VYWLTKCALVALDAERLTSRVLKGALCAVFAGRTRPWVGEGAKIAGLAAYGRLLWSEEAFFTAVACDWTGLAFIKKKLLAIYCSQEKIISDLLFTRNIFKDLLYIRNNIKIRTILRICSQYANALTRCFYLINQYSSFFLWKIDFLFLGIWNPSVQSIK